MRIAAFIVGLCLLGFVSAQSESYAWKVGKQYIYRVDGRLMSGISKINTQYAGLQLKYKVIVTVTGPNRLNLNPVDLKAVELNEEIEGGWREGMLRGESQAEIPHELRQYLESPIEVTLRKGIVESIQVQGDLPTWAINMKRAQASILTLDSTGVNAIVKGNLNRPENNNVRPEEHSGYFYETMEQTIHGECETYYTVNEQGALEPPFPVQKQQAAPKSKESKSSSSSEESRESRYRKPSRPYFQFKKLAQREDSESFEDSQETKQGELPWPKAFENFCHHGQEVYEIVKAVNFTTCKQKPVLAYVTPAELYCRPGDNTCGSLWNRAIITRYLACGTSRKQFTILRMNQEERIHFGIRETQKTLVGTVKNITLIEIKDGGAPEHVKNPRTINNLVYQFNPREERQVRDGKLQYAQPKYSEESRSAYRQHRNKYQSSSSSSSSESNEPGKTSLDSSSETSEESFERYQKDAPYLQQKWARIVRKLSGESDSNSDSSNSDSDSDSNSSSDSQSRESRESNERRERGTPLVSEKPSMRKAPLNPLLISPLDKQGMLQRVRELMKEVVRDLSRSTETESMAEKETLSKIFTVAKILRRLDYDDVYQLYNTIASKKSTEEEQTARQIFLDTIAIAGTNPNHLVIFELIKKGNLNGERAAQILMSLPMYVRTPTVEYLKEYFHLVKETQQQKHRQVRTTAILSFSNILFQACVNARTKQSRFPVAIYGEFCNERIVAQEFLPYYLEKLESHWKSDSAEDKHFTVVFLNALGNIGHPRVIPYVQRILDQSPSSFLKMKAIFSLKHLIVSRDTLNVPENMREVTGIDREAKDLLTDELIEKKVLPILVAVAHDKSEHPEVRMAAISLLWYTTPADLTIWQHLAYSTWFETSQQVQSFIYSSLKSLAHENRPVTGINWRMQQKARIVLPLAKEILPGAAKSRNLFTSEFVDELATGYSAHLSYFGSKDSVIPNNVYFRNFYQFGNGGMGVNPLEFSIHGHSVHKILAHIINKVTNHKDSDLRKEHQDLEFIRKELGIESREQEEPIKGTLHIKIRNEMERLFSINEETINNLIRQLKSKALPNLRSALPFNFQKVFVFAEHTMAMPSAFGLPVVYKFHMPITVSLKGAVKVNGVRNGEMQVQAEVHPVYTWKTHASISFKVPFTGKKYQAGVQRHFVVEAPFRVLLTKTDSQILKLAITPAHLKAGTPQGKIDLISYHQKPYTAIITDELYPTIYPRGGKMKIVRSLAPGQAPVEREMTFGRKKLGLEISLKTRSDYAKENEGQSAWVRFLRKFHTPGCWFNVGWLGAPTIKHVERKVVLNLDRSATNTLVFMIGGQRKAHSLRGILGSSSESSESSSSSSESKEQRLRTSRQESSSSSQSSSSSSSSSSSEEQISRFAKKLRLNKVSESVQQHPEQGRIVVAALVGKKNYIKSIKNSQGIQNLLQGPTTVQYMVQFTKTQERVFIRAAAGDAANEAAALLPQSLQTFAKHIINPVNNKEQQDACINFEGHYDAPAKLNRHILVVLRKTLLEQDLKVKVEAALQFGRSCKNMQHKIKLEGDLKRGPKMTKWALDQSPEARKCIKDEQKGFEISPVCLKVAEHQAAALNVFDIQLEHTQMPIRVRNATYHVRDFVKAYLYPYMSQDYYPQSSIGQGKINLQVRLTPNKEFLTVFITRHNSVLKFQNIKTGRIIKSILPLTATQSLLNNVRDRVMKTQSEPMCALQDKFISTFDNVTYRFDKEVTKGCYHVLTKDCTGRRPIAVLVKNIDSKQKTVAVLLPGENKIKVVSRSQHDHQVTVNQQEVQLPHFIHSQEKRQKLIATIEKMPNGGIQILGRKIRVATDGDKVVVFGSNSLRNKTCGICGDFNGEKQADMKSPKNCPLSSGTLFVASYAFQQKDQKDSCKVDPQVERQIKREEQICRESGLKSSRRVKSIFGRKDDSSSSSSSSSSESNESRRSINRESRKLRQPSISGENSRRISREQSSSSSSSSSSSESREQQNRRRNSQESRENREQKYNNRRSSESREQRSGEQCFQKMQFVTEDPWTSGKICFSLKKMPLCRQTSGCRPVETKNKKIEFLCVPRSVETRRVEQKIENGQFVDLNQELGQFTNAKQQWISVQLPKYCKLH
jgi:hypothetical protein